MSSKSCSFCILDSETGHSREKLPAWLGKSLRASFPNFLVLFVKIDYTLVPVSVSVWFLAEATQVGKTHLGLSLPEKPTLVEYEPKSKTTTLFSSTLLIKSAVPFKSFSRLLMILCEVPNLLVFARASWIERFHGSRLNNWN